MLFWEIGFICFVERDFLGLFGVFYETICATSDAAAIVHNALGKRGLRAAGGSTQFTDTASIH